MTDKKEKIFKFIQNYMRSSRECCGHLPEFLINEKSFNILRMTEDNRGLYKYYFTCEGYLSSHINTRKINGTIIMDKNFNIKGNINNNILLDTDSMSDIISLTEEEMNSLLLF